MVKCARTSRSDPADIGFALLAHNDAFDATTFDRGIIHRALSPIAGLLIWEETPRSSVLVHASVSTELLYPVLCVLDRRSPQYVEAVALAPAIRGQNFFNPERISI